MKHTHRDQRLAVHVTITSLVIVTSSFVSGCRSDDARASESTRADARESIEPSYVVPGPFLDATPVPIAGAPSSLCMPLEITLSHKNLPKCVAEVRLQCPLDQPASRIVVHLQAFDSRNEMLYESWEEAQDARRGQPQLASTAAPAEGIQVARFHVGRDVGTQMYRATLQFVPY
jgi:hypothetical protein